MTDDELSKLEALAQAATHLHIDGFGFHIASGADMDAYDSYIAAANPAALLALIADVRRLRVALDELQTGVVWALDDEQCVSQKFGVIESCEALGMVPEAWCLYCKLRLLLAARPAESQ